MEMKVLTHGLPIRVTDGDEHPATRSDEELVAAARDEPSHFVALYDRYFPRVHGYVRLRIADEATCEDITSLVFLTALAKIGSFHGRGSFSAWLFRLAQNAVYDVYRRRDYNRLAEDTLLAIPDPASGPEEQVLAADAANRLRAVLDTLPAEQQHLLALRFGAGLSSLEIGRTLGKNPVAIRVSMHRIVAELRRRYSDEEI